MARYETEFYFSFYRDIASEDDKVLISLYLHENTPFELNKKYELGSEKTKRATISFKKNGVDYLFSAIEGYIVFTDLWRGSSSSIISGCFEFTAIDIEKGLTLKVTNGIFQDLEC